MSIDLEFAPKQKRRAGAACCEAGIVDSERQGLWAYYYVLPDALQELSAWLN